MSVYVGIDVHRKRSQVAVITADGKVQLNKNVVSGSEPMLRLIGDLPSGTPVAFEAAFGWGWLVQLLEDARQHRDHARDPYKSQTATGPFLTSRGSSAAGRRPARSSTPLRGLRALQLDPWPRGGKGPGSCEEGSIRTVSPARRRA